MNFQVVQKLVEGTNLIQRDKEGQFLETKPLEEVMPRDGSGKESPREEEEMSLQIALKTVSEERSSLEEEVSALRLE